MAALNRVGLNQVRSTGLTVYIIRASREFLYRQNFYQWQTYMHTLQKKFPLRPPLTVCPPSPETNRVLHCREGLVNSLSHLRPCFIADFFNSNLCDFADYCETSNCQSL